MEGAKKNKEMEKNVRKLKFILQEMRLQITVATISISGCSGSAQAMGFSFLFHTCMSTCDGPHSIHKRT